MAAILFALAHGAGSAGAFRIGAHKALTSRAVALERAALPELGVHEGAMVNANAREDLNLLVKWFRASHFYKPGVALESKRATSDVRVRAMWNEALEAAARGRFARAYDRVGRVLHHIQDMASPPHVVPVNHWLTDRFEAFPMAQLIDDLERDDGPSVGALPARRAHDELAARTLAIVRRGRVATQGRALRWRDFWQENGGAFGRYGVVGNRFGDTKLRFRDGTPDGATLVVGVERARYVDFVRSRLADALAYSRAFLRYAVPRLRGAALRAARAKGARSP